MRPIDADEVFRLRDEQCDNCESLEPCFDCIIKRTPTLDYAPVVHAHWMLFEKDEFGNIFQCSKCRKPQTTESFEDYPDVNFCSNCGAKMDENDGEEQ